MPFLFLLVYIALSYVYPGEIFPKLAPYRITYWVGLGGMAVAALWIAFKRSTPLSTPALWFLLAFWGVLSLSLMYAERWLGGAIHVTLDFGPALAMFIVTICAVDTLRRLRIVAFTVVALSLFLVAQGAAAYHFGYHTEMFLFDPVLRTEYVASEEAVQRDEVARAEQAADLPEGESTQVRIRGLGQLHDPNDLALGLILALPLPALWWRSRAVARNLLFVIVPMILIAYGVYLTHSRGGAIALAVTVWLASTRKLGIVPGAILLAVLVAAALGANFAGDRQFSMDDSAQGRVTAWIEGMEMLKSQPLLGVGYGQFLDHHERTAHNSFVLCFAETGLLGYFIWLGLLLTTIAPLRALDRAAATEGNDAFARASWVLQLSAAGFMTGAFFLSRTFVPMLYLLLGLCVALALIAREAGGPVWKPSLPRLGPLILASEIGSILLIYVLIKLNLA